MRNEEVVKDDDELDIRRLLAILYRYRWILILFTLSGVVISFVIAYFKPNVYQTSSTVEVQVKNPWGWGGQQNMVTSALTGGTVNSLSTEMEIIRSRFVTAKALKSVDFSHHYYITKHFKKIELYKDSPFRVELTKGYDITFHLYPIDENKFRCK